MSTVLAYMKKALSGLVFFEGFENQNWLVAEGWTTLKGNPSSTNSAYHDGQFSYQNSGTGATLAQITTHLSSNAKIVSVWFYDSGVTTAGIGPYIKVKLSDNTYVSVGVRNSVSTSVIAYGPVKGSTDAPTTASSASRVIGGWIALTFLVDGSTLKIYANSSLIYTVSTAALATDVFIMSGTSIDTGTTFGFFDTLYAFSDVYFYVKNVSTSQLNLYDSTNTYISSYTPASGTIAIPIFAFNFNIIQSFYMEISDPAHSGNVQHREALRQYYPGDIYLYNSIDFGRKLTSWQPRENNLINQNQSDSGVTETLFNGFKARHTLGLEKGQGWAFKKQLNEFYADCAQGVPFSMVGNNSNGVGLAVVSAAPVVASQTLTLMLTLSANPNTNFIVGKNYRIFSLDGSRRQKVTLASKASTNQLVFNEYLKYSFQQGDVVCDETMLPFLEIGGNPDGFNFGAINYLYFDWLQQCQEYTGA